MQVELLHIVDVNVKWYSCFGIWASSQFLLNLNMYLPYDQAITFLGIYQREMKTNVHKKFYERIFIVALFTNIKIC